MTELFVNVNGIKICYEIHGSEEKSPILLIHGFGNRKEHWLAQIGDLSLYFRVIGMDNRGAGKSARPNGLYSMEIYADDIKALLDLLKIQKTHIIGHSLGGMIVQNFVLKYPFYVDKIVLINTIAGITPSGVPSDKGIQYYKESKITSLNEMRKDPINNFIAGAKKSYSRNFWKEMAQNPKKKFHGIWSVEDLVKEKMEYGPTEKDIINQVEALKTHNIYERLHEIKNEVLILAADKDKTCPKIMVEKMQNLIPNSHFIVIPDAGHQSILEYPQIINQYIIKFLKS